MKIAVTGKNGQIVQSLLAIASKDFEVIAIGRPELDLTVLETIFPRLAAIEPDIIISAAAYTAVDQAQDEPELAYAVNAKGAGAVSEAAAKLGIPIIHISTDYVFDGEKIGKYTETDQPNPKTVYGATKLQGEILVSRFNLKHIILRTAWVYSPYGNNFLKTMLKLASERKEIHVVSDQHGNPTSAENIATIILMLCHYIQIKSFKDWGVYHVVDNSETTWYDWAKFIFESAGIEIVTHPINTSDYPSKAQRPKNSSLATDKIKKILSCEMQNLKPSTLRVIQRLKAPTV
ncbi:MAG TPA: dTDP-4-dehydrorhamnose reductase [Pseudochrobactrum sp.]|nr:dTDP-4-dehydrorhamnose reductase [Pseudochrobactrum sp.]